MEPVRTFVGVTTRLYQRVSAHLILTGAFVCLVYFLGYFLLNSTFATQAFDTSVNRLFRGNISWTRVSWGPLPWQIRILEPVLLDGRGRPVITAKTLSVDDFRILDLLNDRIAADGVTLDAPVIRLTSRIHPSIRDAMGRPKQVMNINEMFWPPGPRYSDGQVGTTSLEFTGVNIRDAVFVLDTDKTAIVAHGLQLSDGRFDLPAGHDSALGIGASSVRIDRGSIRIATQDTMGRPLTAPLGQTMDFPIKKMGVRQFSWVGDEFKIAKIRGKLRDDPLIVERFSMDLGAPDLPVIAARIELRSQAVEAQLLPLGVDGITGPAHVTVAGRGEIDAFDGQVTIDSPVLDLYGVKIENVSLRGHHSPEGDVSLASLEMSLGGGVVRGQGAFRLVNGDGHLDLWPENVDVTQLSFPLPKQAISAVAGKTSGEVHLAAQDVFGDKSAYRGIVHLKTRRTHSRRLGLGPTLKIDTIAELVDDVLSIESLEVNGVGDRVSVKGDFNLYTYVADLSGRLRLDDLRPATAAFGVPVGGSVSLGWSLSGLIFRPKLSAQVDGKNVGYADLPTANISGRVGFDQGILELDRFQMKSETGMVGIQGTMNLLSRSQRVNVRINARQFELAALPLGLGISGRAALDVKVTGPLKNPVVQGRGRIGRPCWTSKFREEPLCYRRLDTDGRWSTDRFSISKLTLQDDERVLVDVKGKGRFKSRGFDGRVIINRIPIALANYFIKDALPLQGEITADLGLNGTLSDPRGSGSIQLHRTGYADYRLGDTRLNIQADSSLARITGHIFNDVAVLASVPTGPGATGEAILSLNDFVVERWLPQLKERPLQSALTGTVTLTFDPFARTFGGAKVALTKVAASYSVLSDARYVMESRDELVMTYRDGLIEIERLDAKLRLEGRPTMERENVVESFMVMGGSATVDGTLDLSYRGTMDLSLAQPFLRTIFSQTSGQVSVHGKLTGMADELVPTADVVVEAAELVPRVSLIGAQLELLQPVSLQVRPRTVDESGQQVALAAGRFDISLKQDGGDTNRLRLLREESVIESDDLLLSFERFVPSLIRIGIRGSELGLNIPRLLRGTFNTPELVFEMWEQTFDDRRPEKRMKLSGRVEVVSGEYIADITGAEEINRGFRDRLTGRTQTSTISLFERIPSLKRLMLDLAVTGDGDFFLRNQVLTLTTDMELRLKLDRISGFLHAMPHDLPEDRLAIEGQITVLPESKLIYARREFDVTQGVVDFGGLNFLDASVQASETFTLRTGQSASTASTSFETGSGDIRLEEVVLAAKLVFPTRESPPTFEFNLSSNSGASNFEVAMLVLTGSYPENLSGAASAQPAAEVVLAPLLNLVERPLEDTFNVDLTLTPVSSGTLYIDANKILSRRLRLYSRVLVGDDEEGSPQQFRLEYQINNIAFGQLSNEQSSNKVSTSGLLHFRLNLN